MRELRPSPGLAPHVGRCVAYEHRISSVLTAPELPFAGAVLLVVLGDALEIDGARVRSFASGVYDRPVMTAMRGHQRIIQLYFEPLAARRLFGVPMDELTNCVVSADELFGAELEARAGDAPDLDAAWDVVQRALLERLGDPPRPEIAWVYRQIAAGADRIEPLAQEIGWSRRHLATTFRREVGVTPKTLARIVRFSRAHALVREGGDLADVAFECGFADQPHFTREVRELAWTTPSALAA